MADRPAAPPAAKSPLGGRLSAKVGPLPVWAWAVIILVVGYYLYRRSQSSSAQATGTTPAAATDQTPVTPDQSASDVGSGSGGSGLSTTPPGLGVSDAAQAAGGGTFSPIALASRSESGPITPSSAGTVIAAGQITPSGQIDTGGSGAGAGGPLRGHPSVAARRHRPRRKRERIR